MSPTLDELLTPRALGEGRFEMDIPDGWQQGRGCFGGLILGGMVRAALAEAPGRLRSVEAAMLGPVAVGTAQIAVQTLRQGKAVSGLAVSLSQEDAVLDHAIVVTGADRADPPQWFEPARPQAPAWRDLEAWPADNPFAPTFTRHFEYRPAGPLPYSAGPEAVTSGWVRPRQAPPRLDAAWLALLADTLWTAAFTRMSAPRPVATLSYTLHLVEPADGLDPAAPVYLSCRAPVCSGGYLSEERLLWGEDMRLLAVNHQLIAVIR